MMIEVPLWQGIAAGTAFFTAGGMTTLVCVSILTAHRDVRALDREPPPLIEQRRPMPAHATPPPLPEPYLPAWAQPSPPPLSMAAVLHPVTAAPPEPVVEREWKPWGLGFAGDDTSLMPPVVDDAPTPPASLRQPPVEAARDRFTTDDGPPRWEPPAETGPPDYTALIVKVGGGLPDWHHTRLGPVRSKVTS